MKQGKKQPKAPQQPFPWKKVGVVVFCVLIAVLMVVSTLGFGWLTSMKDVVPGDTVLLEYTIRDSEGRPVITTNMALFNKTMEQMGIVLIASPLRVVAGTNYTRYIVPVEAYIPTPAGYQPVPYGLFGTELSDISQAMPGTRTGQTKTVDLAGSSIMDSLYMMSDEQFAGIGGNVSQVSEGSQLMMRMPVDRNISAETANQTQMVSRIGYIISKDNGTVMFDLGHATFEGRIASINPEGK